MAGYVPYRMKIPNGWLDYTNFGKPLDNLPIVPCKVPLSEERLKRNNLNQKDYFSPQILMDKVPKLGGIINLTNTSNRNSYYDSTIFSNSDKGIIYQRINCEGQAIPNSDVTQEFFLAMDSFLQDEKSRGKFIMVHCTHGLNRTGYLLVRYLVERIGLKPSDAIRVFEKARGYSMEKDIYLRDLESLEIGRSDQLLPKKNWWSETYLTWSTQDTGSGNPPSTNFNRPTRVGGAGPSHTEKGE